MKLQLFLISIILLLIFGCSTQDITNNVVKEVTHNSGVAIIISQNKFDDLSYDQIKTTLIAHDIPFDTLAPKREMVYGMFGNNFFADWSIDEVLGGYDAPAFAGNLWRLYQGDIGV